MIDCNGFSSPLNDSDHMSQSTTLRDRSVSCAVMEKGEQEHASVDALRTPQRNVAVSDHVALSRNGDGRIICDHPEAIVQCAGLTFERKCDWLKHMNKHDRPYKCEDPACKKIRGFTYSGGLLRHRREVHKSGTMKNILYCPYPYCKRNCGDGFTRKENLKEHMSRVHRPIGGTAHGGRDASKLERVTSRSMISPLLSTIAIPEITKSTVCTPKLELTELEEHPVDLLVPGTIRDELTRLRQDIESGVQQMKHLHAILHQRDVRIANLEHNVEMMLLEQKRGMAQERTTTREAVMH